MPQALESNRIGGVGEQASPVPVVAPGPVSRWRGTLWAARAVGFGRLWRLARAQRLVWSRYLNGFYVTRLVQTLLNVGFFDEMQQHGRVEPDAFAAQHGLDAALLRSMCDTLYGLRLFERDGPAYRMGPDMRLMIEVGRGWFEGVYGYEGVFHSLEALLRKQATYGVEVTRRPEPVARGSGQIEGLLYFPIAINDIAAGGFRTVLDLGCGDGAFLRDVCRALPGVRGCGMDLSPGAVAEGMDDARRTGLADRIELFAGDVTKLDALPTSFKDVDVATTFFVLHEILTGGQQAVVEFLAGFRRLFPGVPLMVFEVDRPSPVAMRQSRTGMAPTYFLQHDLSLQRPMPKEFWPPLFRAAGFTDVRERPLAFARSVVFTLR